MIKKLVLVLTFLCASVKCFAIEDDKLYHFSVSTVIASSVQAYTGDYKTSLGVCLGLGLGKEIYDEYSYGGFDEKDLLADAVGCALGTIVGQQFYLYQHKDATGLGFKFKF